MRLITLKLDEKPRSGKACRVERPSSAGVVVSNLLGPTLVVLSLLAAPTLSAAESAGDCTEIDLRYETLDVPLTDAEIAQRRARRHDASLNAFERCIAAATGGGGSQGGGQGGQGAGQGAGSGAGLAAQGIAGSEPIAAEPQPATETEPAETSQPAQVADATLSNGRAPLDIPPADNDSVLAAQIRRAAESESDPQRKARLWNEYRKIRGLPIPKTGT